MAVPHRKREELPFQNACVLITVSLDYYTPSFRDPETRELVLQALRAAGKRFGLRFLQFSILDYHLHLVGQAHDAKALSRGMQGFLIRLARALNRAWGCTGKVFLERFHSSVIEHYWSLRRAVRYALQNARKHGIALPEDQPDFYSSGPWFRGWSGRNGQPFDTSEPPVSLMERTGRYLEDQRRLLIGLMEVPGPSPCNDLFDG